LVDEIANYKPIQSHILCYKEVAKVYTAALGDKLCTIDYFHRKLRCLTIILFASVWNFVNLRWETACCDDWCAMQQL